MNRYPRISHVAFFSVVVTCGLGLCYFISFKCDPVNAMLEKSCGSHGRSDVLISMALYALLAFVFGGAIQKSTCNATVAGVSLLPSVGILLANIADVYGGGARSLLEIYFWYWAGPLMLVLVGPPTTGFVVGRLVLGKQGKGPPGTGNCESHS